MADILISQLPAASPLLTDLMIIANPTTGIAKKSTVTQLNNVLTLAGLDDVQQVTPPANSILEWDGEFSYVTNIVRASGLALNRIPFLSATTPNEISDSQIYQGTYGVVILDDVAPVNLPSAILNLVSNEKGFLKPRMQTADRTAIGSPATGLEVYDTTLNLPYYYNGTAWKGVQELLISATNIKTINGTSILGSGNIAISAGITTLNTLTATTQTFATSTTGTDFTISSATSTHTFNLPSSSAANRGLLLSADWTTFNNKVGGSGTTNYLSKFTASGTVGNSSITDDGTTLTLLAKTVINGSLTASSSLARYLYLNPTLIASANNDILVGLDINPTYTNGEFTGISNVALRLGSGNPPISSKWGIYQSGANDYNYFAGGMSVGTTQKITGYDLVTNVMYISNFLNCINSTFGSVQTNDLKSSTGNLTFTKFDYSSIIGTWFDTGNLRIGTGIDSGRKLQINGQAEFITTVGTGTHTTSGNHLPIWVNGVKYWLALLNPIA